MRVILRCLAKIRVCPPDDDKVACEPRHDSNSILPLAPHGDLHSQLDGRRLPIIAHVTSLTPLLLRCLTWRR